MTTSKKNYKTDIIIKLIKNIIYTFISNENFHIILFGSRAEGTNTEHSDYDIGIIGAKELNKKTFNHIKAIIDCLPKKIDIINFTNPKINPDFKKIALQKTIKL